MKELEVGQYVRTREGYIAKFVGKNDYFHSFDRPIRDISCLVYDEDNMLFNDEIKEYITKVSDDIIDLIQSGDVISFKFSEDVYKVLCVPNKKVGCEDFYFEYDISQEFEDLRIKPEMVRGQIKSILTKELFEDMSYKVE